MEKALNILGPTWAARVSLVTFVTVTLGVVGCGIYHAWSMA